MTDANNSLLRKLLLQRTGARLRTALGALCTGITLLLTAVLIWWNFSELLNGARNTDSLGSTFLTVSRRVTNANMGHPELTAFSPQDMTALQQAPEVEAVGAVQPVRPRVYMSMELAPGQGFSTIMILEAVPQPFMDRQPADWQWQPGNVQVPIILSSSFLSLYNYVFAPSQGLPQLSEESIKALPFRLSVGSDGHEDVYIAHIAGFSDRITSVLVPEAFAKYANEHSGKMVNDAPSRLVLKVKDPSSSAFVDYLAAHDYMTNSEQLRWSRVRAIVQVVSIAVGVLAILLMGVSMLVFVLFIELTVARAQDSVRLLLQLGYSPKYLAVFLYRRFLPLLSGAVILAGILAVAAQISGMVWARGQQLSLPMFPGWPVWTVLAACLLLLLYLLKRAVGKALHGIG